MSSENMIELIGLLATITSTLQYFTPLFVCRDWLHKKSTGDSSGIPFISGIVTSAVWLKYGLLTNERSLIIVNSIGVATMLAYTIMFYLFTVKKRETVKVFSLSCFSLAILFTYVSAETDKVKATEVIGSIGILVSLIFFASPLANLRSVIRTKNTESLPFSMICSSFIVTFLWFVYGALLNDKFIQVPNFIGCLLLITQLLLFVVYPSKTSLAKSNTLYKPLDLL